MTTNLEEETTTIREEETTKMEEEAMMKLTTTKVYGPAQEQSRNLAEKTS